jgi:hypothetical protein
MARRRSLGVLGLDSTRFACPVTAVRDCAGLQLWFAVIAWLSSAVTTVGGVMDEGTEDGTGRERLSRRTMLTGAGVAITGGIAAGTVGGLIGAVPAEATGQGLIATGPSGTTLVEFISRITQDVAAFSSVGYLTRIAGIEGDDLFTDPAHRDEAHALFVATATGELIARSVDGAVHSLDIEGELSVYLRNSGGASFSDPASFASGRRLARFALELQDVLTVVAPQTGLPTLTGNARQVDTANLRGSRFGRPGQHMRVVATGLGTRSDANTDSPQAQLSVAGSMIAT